METLEGRLRTLLGLQEQAYLLALRMSGSEDAAEDAVQEAYTKAIRYLRRGRWPRDGKVWFLILTANTMRDLLRSESRRRRRDSSLSVAGGAAGPEQAELREVMRGAIGALDPDLRVPLSLHYEGGLTRGEVAAVLGTPLGTVDSRIARGLERIRERLCRLGWSVTPAVLLGLLGQTAPALPERLSVQLREIGTEAGRKGKALSGSAGTAAGGGWIVSLGMGISMLGVAVGIALFGGNGRSGEPAAAQAAPEPAAGFSVPVWSPEARWQMEKFAGCDVAGHLDGPRLEMEYFSCGAMGPLYRPHGAGRYVFSSYDSQSERGHVTAGWARGLLDGPFSRARFGGWDYVTRSAGASSPDGRFVYITDGYNGHVLRCLDLEKQEVRTLLPDAAGLQGLVADSQNRLYLLQGTSLTILAPDGQRKAGPALEIKEDPGQWGFSLALDEKRGRLYATCYGTKNYYVWYWDLKDGSFHGVLPTPAQSGKDRGRNVPGPFEGINLYSQGSVGFGPDDPERRFLYVGRVDTWGWFRLDLEKRIVAALNIESGGKGRPEIVRFSDERFSKVNVYGSAGWMADGSFVSTVHSPYDTWRFRRIK